MRAALALTFWCAFLALATTGDQPVADDTLDWQTAFSPLSAKNTERSLAVILITIDEAIESPTEEGAKLDAKLWCRLLFERMYRRSLQARRDLADHCNLQFLPAGVSKSLTAGKPRSRPARAIVAICDAKYRLLSLTVGVPEADEFLTIIEDAQQVRSFLELQGREKGKIAAAIAERSMKRLTRLWRGALKEMLAAVDVGKDDAAEPAAESSELLISLLSRIAISFEEVYSVDVKLRFGLTEVTDRRRLVVLEQHPETRRPWCESMMPFVAGSDFTETWIPLTEAVWHTDVVTHDVDIQELLRWWDTHSQSDTVAVAIEPPLLARQRPWPAVDVGGVADRRGLGWQDLQKLLLEVPFRNIDASELTALIRARDLAPVDITVPTRARYLAYEPGNRKPWAIREGDVPGKHISRLQRTMKQ
jgi:hypothetical protein